MAGTLVISTLSDGTNSTSSTNCIQGSAKAWVRFNGTGGATINASYNVSSVTYESTATYRINFTNAFADANSSVVSSTSTNVAGQYCVLNTTSIQTTYTRIQTANFGAALVDCALIGVAVLR